MPPDVMNWDGAYREEGDSKGRRPRRFNRLRRKEFDARFPGLLALVLAEAQA